MGLLTKATNCQTYAKIGFLGFPASGKTYTAMQIAIGLAKLSGGKPIAFFDTEKAADFVVPLAAKQGIEVLIARSRAFSDLMVVCREAQSSGCSVLIVDSITHIWRELCEAFRAKLNRTKLQFQDWDTVKGEWSNWTDFYLNSDMHIIVLGRAGYEYDYDSNEDGSRDLVKTGTKMKVESEFGFEPSLLIEMERVSPAQDALEATGKIANIRQRKIAKQNIDIDVGSGWIHRAHILKDRWDVIDGHVFDDPTFESFLPHIKMLNLGGEGGKLDTSSNSQALFQGSDRQAQERNTQRKIALETIQGALTKLWPGSTAIEKRMKNLMVETAFDGTLSWTNVEKWPLADLVGRAAKIKKFAHDMSPLLEDIMSGEQPEKVVQEAYERISQSQLEEPSAPALEDMDADPTV